MDFPWLQSTPAPRDGAARRAKVACTELAQRAGLLYRLGYSQAAATKRLTQHVAWEFDQPAKGAHKRHADLSDQAIAKIVAETFARKPG